MRHRRVMSRGKDKQVFKHTAMKTKDINVKPRIMRGGIRL